MGYKFAEATDFETGMLYLGRDDTGRDKGIATERHAITIAGAGSGKGAALIIPNLLRWQHSACVVDPKGENAEQTWQAREAMGQLVGIVDPFKVANIPDRLRVSINPLASVDQASLTARADIEVIADGLVKRSDPKHTEWDDGAASILAGVIAFVIAEAPPEHRTLIAMRKVLLQGNDVLYQDAQRMMSCNDCGGLAKSAGLTIATALDAEKGMEKDFLAGARRHSRWIDDPAHAAVLGSSTFDPAALKSGNATLYLVIPPQYLDTQGMFLRLFVRSALNAMAKGNRQDGKCLFMLDEFFSLGRLDIIAKAAGLMRSYGVQLWPFLQDLGQLQDLYGVTGAETFFGNADAQIFFGITDVVSSEYISRKAGNLTPEEIAPPFQPEPPVLKDYISEKLEHRTKDKSYFQNKRLRFKTSQDYVENRELLLKQAHDTLRNSDDETEKFKAQSTIKMEEFSKFDGYHYEDEKDTIRRVAHEEQNEQIERMGREALKRAEYEYKMRKVGTPRLTPSDIAEITGKDNGDDVASSMIVFSKKGRVFNIQLAPYFAETLW